MARLLETYCRTSTNAAGRVAACEVLAGIFPGRCHAYRLAEEANVEKIGAVRVANQIEACKQAPPDHDVEFLKAQGWPMPPYNYGWRQTHERRKLTMRFYAAAMDPEIRQAACKAIKATPDLGDIPECATTSAH